MSINLTKGQRISLDKSITRVRMGLGWDPAKKGKRIDLDASCVLLANGSLVDTVWYRQLRSKDGSVQHTGDNVTGRGDGDDESIIVDLNGVPSQVDAIYFTVNSFSRQGFGQVAKATAHLVDKTRGERDLGTLDLSAQGEHKAMLMARVVRTSSGWRADMIGETVSSGRTVQSLIVPIQQHLQRNPIAA